jgi:phosphoribosylamine--glycine ligase
MQRRGVPFKGFLFVGLMIVNDEPFVLEYNVRLGDPETQCILPRLDGDFASILHAAATGQIKDKKVPIRPGYSTTIVLASEGYPGNFPTGLLIEGLDELDDASLLFHAGTKSDGEDLLTAGGRVLAITSHGDTPEVSRLRALACAEEVDYPGRYYRKDIGKDMKAWREQQRA